MSSLLSVSSATSSRWWLDKVRRTRPYYAANTRHSSAPVVTFSRRLPSNASLPRAAFSTTLIRPARWMRATAVSQKPYEPQNHQNDSSTWKVFFAASLALATSVTLVAATPRSRNEGHHPDTLVSLGGTDGEDFHSLGYATPPLKYDDDNEESPKVPAVSEEGRKDDDGNEQSPKVPASTTTAAMSEERRKVYDVSVRAIKGGRVTMEDEFFVADGGRFAAVFDGHGGGGVSTFLKRHLYDRVRRSLAQKLWEDDRKPNARPSLALRAAALRSAFQDIDSAILSDDTLKYQGSTAVAVVVHESEDGHRTLLSANVGDSRAILSRGGQSVNLTKDHKPNDESEKARILSMGETIEWDRFAKVHRVRNLSLSRAIGDRYAKPVVSGEVEIQHFPVIDGKDEFFLLASDGVWDVMTSQDVVSYVHNQIEKELRRARLDSHDVDGYKLVLRRNIAKFVAREALRKGSGDNICVLIVWLNDLERSSSQSS